MKILAFCFFPAFVPPSNGGQSRLFNFYYSLSKLHEVVLLTSSHLGVEDECIIHGANFVERRIAKDDYFAQQYAQLEKYSSGGDLSGPAIAACGSFPTRLHQAYLEEYEKANVIIHDFPFTSHYDIFAGVDNKPRVYNAHNCESRLYQQLHACDTSQPVHEIVRQAEIRMLNMADLVLYCNSGDLEQFRQMAPDAGFNAFYVPNGMVPLAFSTPSVRPSSKRLKTVFMGSGHPPNASAAEFIVNTLAPQLPHVDFDIIGSCLPEGQYLPNVQRHGVVTEYVKNRLLGDVNLALNPMSEGSGSNVKVLDYFAHGVAVLSSSFGMRGIQAMPGRDFLESDPEQFVAELERIAANPDLLDSIGQNGYELAMEHYAWESIAARTAGVIESLVTEKATAFKRSVLVLNDYDSFAGIGGGGTRTRGLYAAVSEWSPVVFVSFSDDGYLQSREYAKNIIVINVPKTREHLTELQHVNARFHVSADDIVASRHSASNVYLATVYKVLRQYARSIVIEHCYLASIPRAWGDRFVYSSHNNETELKRLLLNAHPLKEALLRDVEQLERFAVENSAATIAVSREDAESLVKYKRASGPVIVVRNGAAEPAQGEAVEQNKAKLYNQLGERGVVFLGSAHMPNVEAARFVTNVLAPQCPDVQFHLLGSVCGTVIGCPANVKLWGVVDDEIKSALMQSCLLAINPVLSGSGSNVKLADYIGNGLYVVTSEFGQRGYPESVHEHLDVVPLDGFVAAIQHALGQPGLHTVQARKARQELFFRELSMQGLAARFVETLQGLEVKRKRVLYVAYRYVEPALGGAELNIEKFVSALGHSGQFDVDVITPEVSAIHNYFRFAEHYTFDPSHGVPVDIPNVRFARFPVDAPAEQELFSRLCQAWRTQPLFEKAVSGQLISGYIGPGLSWGWGYPEEAGTAVSRWAFTECAVYVKDPGKVILEGYAPAEIVITAYAGGALTGGPWSVQGRFKLEFDLQPGEVVFSTSAPLQPDEPRPLGFLVSRLLVGNQLIDLAAPMLFQQHLSDLPAETVFRMLAYAAEVSRTPAGVSLTDVRGPWSQAMERYIADHVVDYDLVIAHNNVFRPAVVAMAEASKQGVPSILVPHAHLDDDYYHFPDWLQSARHAGLVLAAPKAACAFLLEKGCNARYLPAGCDATEQFTQQDIDAFRQLHPGNRPFILVLGRKAGAKGYRTIIDAVERLNSAGQSLDVVLIGPDDDGQPVDSEHAKYLGRQPRDVVRGALQSCVALCNMSSSESFGIVLLEAWLAGKPVIANKNCVAFHDMAIDRENALLVEPAQTMAAIQALCTQPELAARLAENGRHLVERFAWDSVSSQFVDICLEYAQSAITHQATEIT